MNRKNILVMTTLDSKEEAAQLVCQRVRDKGHSPMTLDLSVMNEPTFEPTISSVEVAIAGGGSAADVRGEVGDRNKRLALMTRGARKIVRELVDDGKIDGIIGLGGLSNATIVSTVCQSLPIGIPKLILSSAAGMSKYDLIGRSDIALLATVFETDFMNPFLRSSVVKAANMICGAVESETLSVVQEVENLRSAGMRVIAVTQFRAGECIAHLIKELDRRGGYSPIVFHANGIGDMVMEDLIEDGVRFDAVADLCIAGVSERLMGGNRAAGPSRLDAAAKRGIPQIITPTALDYISCGP